MYEDDAKMYATLSVNGHEYVKTYVITAPTGNFLRVEKFRAREDTQFLELLSRTEVFLPEETADLLSRNLKVRYEREAA